MSSANPSPDDNDNDVDEEEARLDSPNDHDNNPNNTDEAATAEVEEEDAEFMDAVSTAAEGTPKMTPSAAADMLEDDVDDLELGESLAADAAITPASAASASIPPSSPSASSSYSNNKQRRLDEHLLPPPPGGRSKGRLCRCGCIDCQCGDSCQCTETGFRCTASCLVDSFVVDSGSHGNHNSSSHNNDVHGPTKTACCGKRVVVDPTAVDEGSNSSSRHQPPVLHIQHDNNSNNHDDQMNEISGGSEDDVMDEDCGMNGATTAGLDAPDDDSLLPNHAAAEMGIDTTDLEAGAPTQQPPPPPQQQQRRKRRAEFWIDGMTCTMCSQAVEQAIRQAVPASVLESVAVSLATDSAVVTWDSGEPNVVVATTDATAATTTTTTTPGDPPHEHTPAAMTLKIQDAIEAVGYSVERVVILGQPEPAAAAPVPEDSGAATTTTTTTIIEDPLATTTTTTTPLPTDHSNNNTTTNNNNDHVETSTVEDRWERLQQRQAEKVDGRRNAFLWSLLGTLPILLLTMVLPHDAHWLKWLHRPVTLTIGHHQYQTEWEVIVLWALATPVQFIAGWEFYRGTWYSLHSCRAGMDVLIALGTTASYSYALLMGLGHGDVHAAHFFETAAVLIAFVLGGKWMQAYAVRRTSQALSQLMQLQAKTAIHITPLSSATNLNMNSKDWLSSFHPSRDAYHEEVRPIQHIQAGDLVKVLRGASIPADGRVLFGEMSVDESMVTGEPLPVLKTPGSIVLGGTVCVESSCGSGSGGNSSHNHHSNRVASAITNATDRDVGAAFVQVTGVGSSTALAQIVQLVQEAQTRAVPIQSFADAVSAVFVPTVCALSVLTFVIWYTLIATHVVPASWYIHQHEDPFTFSLLFAIACLVISCPCALGLATPTAVMVGTGVAAKLGVLMKGGEALELAAVVDSVIFDKTGTLTQGKPSVTDFLRLDDQGQEAEEHLLWLLGTLERSSEHPLAKAIVTFAEKRLGEDKMARKPFTQPTQFRAMTGRGASGNVGDVTIAVGNRAFVEALDYEVTFVAEECMAALEEEAKTAILVVVDGVISAVLGISDEIKPDAAAAINFLRHKMDIDVWMVTGDNRRTATAVSQQLDLPLNRVIAEALPAAKLQQVRKLQSQGKIVAMVGDGVNDSPALAQANVGMSLGTGASIANETSDIVLVKGHVADVCTALDLSRVIFRRIQWNFLWSLVYNCLGIPIAAGVFYPLIRARLPPTVAAVAMALSSVSVVMSSLLLRWYKPPVVMEPTSSSSRRRGGGSRNSRDRIREERHERRRRRQQRRVTISSANGDDDLRSSLLEHDYHSSTASAFDHSEVTDTTEPIDNRTLRRYLSEDD